MKIKIFQFKRYELSSSRTQTKWKELKTFPSSSPPHVLPTNAKRTKLELRELFLFASQLKLFCISSSFQRRKTMKLMSFLLFSCSFPFQRSDTSWQEFPFKRCDGTKGAHLKALIPCHMYSHSNKSCPALHERLLISLMRWNVHLHLRLTLFCTSQAEGFGDVIITMGWLYPCMYQLCAFAYTECHLAIVEKVQRPFMNREFRNSPRGRRSKTELLWSSISALLLALPTNIIFQHFSPSTRTDK